MQRLLKLILTLKKYPMKLLLTFSIAFMVCHQTLLSCISIDRLMYFIIIDPTTVNAQGPDVGTQYRSAIFYRSSEQKAIAEKVTAQVQEKHFKGKKIVTELIPAGVFYDAETYHQV